MGKKYKVCCDGHFMGHYHHTDPQKAVEKAIKEHWSFKPAIYLDKTASFSAQKDSMSKEYRYSWKDFPKFYPHIDSQCC